MTSPGSGGCLCGAIRFECRGAPISAVFCHCRNCQKAHAAPFAAVVLVPPGGIEVTAGRVRRHEMLADSGAMIFREFCDRCGTHLFSGGAAFPQFKSVKLATLDDPSTISPVAHVWTENALGWMRIADDLPCFPKQAEMGELERLWAEHERRR
jgi:hypothetical protein